MIAIAIIAGGAVPLVVVATAAAAVALVDVTIVVVGVALVAVATVGVAAGPLDAAGRLATMTTTVGERVFSVAAMTFASNDGDGLENTRNEDGVWCFVRLHGLLNEIAGDLFAVAVLVRLGKILKESVPLVDGKGELAGISSTAGRGRGQGSLEQPDLSLPDGMGDRFGDFVEEQGARVRIVELWLVNTLSSKELGMWSGVPREYVVGCLPEDKHTCIS